MVPGHEIVGRVVSVGDHVKNFKAGDVAGVGCLVDSCRKCENCNEGLEQYCLYGAVYTDASAKRKVLLKLNEDEAQKLGLFF
jgi:uncharacterized zinc-type alcohol dehydrogenase-like protein